MNKKRKFWFFFLLLTTYSSLLTSSWAAPNFTQETAIRLSSASAQTILEFGSTFRMYFIRDNAQIRTSTSTDGLNWSEEPGFRLSTSTILNTLDASSITACAILPLDTTGYRMLYTALSSTNSYHVLSATSTDGLGWAKESGVRFQASTSTTFIGSIRLQELSDGRWRMYYLQDSTGGNNPQNYELRSALSTNEGVTWSTEGKRISAPVGPFSAITLTNAKTRLLYLAPLANQTTYSQVLSQTSSDGTTFTPESSARLSTDSTKGSYASLLVYRSTENFRWRAYTGFTVNGSTTPNVYSDLTQTPSFDSIDPARMYKTQNGTGFTIKGEVFSSTPTVRLTRAGASDIAATGITRLDDQTITGSLTTLNQPLGSWQLVITNDDGQSTSVEGAVTIDFPSGDIQITDNLFKPKEGGRARIDVTIYNDSVVTLRIFTINGMPVKTVLDESKSAGTFSVFWNGDTDGGNTVASGLYYLRSKGAKLNRVDKIIVVK